ncbi:DUF1599 domain-containing protein [Gaoshiqia sp. Z1-71]|uniref:DUF1599 domain-containing protein n=1 Tax=Gaoshiqia hydrogeniformans TaxID=3290090 RepID=UPI003BF8D223
MEKTIQEYDQVISICQDIFTKKMNDYGTAWRILRTSSLTDQLYIKACRIRNIEMKGTMKVKEDSRSEYIGIVNYCIMALIQLEKGTSEVDDLSPDETLQLYLAWFNQAKELMLNKNHDYDEAWRNMRLSSVTDLILMKIRRIKQIEDHAGKTIISEGVDANYLDMINYAVFALIMLEFYK